MRSAVVVFTRDLRVRDHPALHAAASADRVVPLFVLDDAMVAGPHRSANRLAYLCGSLADLDASLQNLGAGLVVRRGDWARNVARVAEAVAADEVHLSDDVSAWSRRRCGELAARLGADVRLVTHPGAAVVPPGAISPTGGGEFKVFTPYYRRWLEAPWRTPLPAPERLAMADLEPGPRPDLAELTRDAPSPSLEPGGETAALARLKQWAADRLAGYGDHHDDLPGDRTSRVSAALHFGCLSPLEVAWRLRERPGAEPFVRQLCWRDFYLQILAARPDASRADYRDRGDVWLDDDEGFTAWCDGRTGFPVVDAGMRQLRAEGFMHNRARMITASFLTKDLGIDWRRGAAHFMAWLVDGDVANNQLNWQWTAGTGTDTNPHRIFNPTVQGKRFDPDGTYIRRYVPELATVAAPAIHEPDAATRAACGYPAPILDHHEAIAAYRARRAR